MLLRPSPKGSPALSMTLLGLPESWGAAHPARHPGLCVQAGGRTRKCPERGCRGFWGGRPQQAGAGRGLGEACGGPSEWYPGMAGQGQPGRSCRPCSEAGGQVSLWALRAWLGPWRRGPFHTRRSGPGEQEEGELTGLEQGGGWGVAQEGQGGGCIIPTPSLTDTPVGSQLGNAFPPLCSFPARALGCSRSC